MTTEGSTVLERIGPVGAIIAVFSCPVCLPVFAIGASALGMGIYQPFEGTLFLVFRILVAVATVGHIIAFVIHRKLLPLIVGLVSPAIIFLSLYLQWNNVFLYLGLVGLFIATPMNFLAKQNCAPCKPAA